MIDTIETLTIDHSMPIGTISTRWWWYTKVHNYNNIYNTYYLDTCFSEFWPHIYIYTLYLPSTYIIIIVFNSIKSYLNIM